MCSISIRKIDTQDFQGQPSFLISDDKFMWELLRAPWASSDICGFSQYTQNIGGSGHSLGAGMVNPPMPLVTFCFGAFMIGSQAWLCAIHMPQLLAFEAG
jgi:hypothetical protein